jgi:uncharacterized membrane protein YheB (UPF0754 family)
MNFDHLSLLSDEYNLKKVKAIKKILIEFKEEYVETVFSDYMNKIKNTKEKERIILLVTQRSFYLINKNFILIKRYLLKDILSLITIQSNSSFIILELD